MAKERRRMSITPEEKRKLLKVINRRDIVIRTGGFYSKPGPCDAVSRFDKASIRRAAGIYLQNS